MRGWRKSALQPVEHVSGSGGSDRSRRTLMASFVADQAVIDPHAEIDDDVDIDPMHHWSPRRIAAAPRLDDTSRSKDT